jgi:capsular polysaccharide biosynthesis protein
VTRSLPAGGRRPRDDAGSSWTLWDALSTFSFRNLVFAMVLGVLAAGGGAAVGLSQKTLYSSNANLLIDQPKQIADAQNEGVIHKLALLKIKYVDLATTPSITRPAAEQLGLSEGTVAASVQAVTSPADLLLVTVAQSGNASQATRIANAVALSIANYADSEQERIGIPSADRYRFVLVQQASAAAKVQPKLSRALQAAAGLGVLGLALSYVILQLLTADVRLV